MREHKASELSVTIGRLMYRMRQDELRMAKARAKRPLTYKASRRDHKRESLPRW